LLLLNACFSQETSEDAGDGEGRRGAAVPGGAEGARRKTGFSRPRRQEAEARPAPPSRALRARTRAAGARRWRHWDRARAVVRTKKGGSAGASARGGARPHAQRRAGAGRAAGVGPERRGRRRGRGRGRGGRARAARGRGRGDRQVRRGPVLVRSRGRLASPRLASPPVRSMSLSVVVARRPTPCAPRALTRAAAADGSRWGAALSKLREETQTRVRRSPSPLSGACAGGCAPRRPIWARRRASGSEAGKRRSVMRQACGAPS